MAVDQVGGGLWASSAPGMVYDALQRRYDQDSDDRERELQRYADYRDGRPVAIEKYFTRRRRETQARFEDRPKLSWPLCRSIVDIHAEALTKGLEVRVQDPDADAFWQLLAAANEAQSFWYKVATTAGTYGSCWVRPLLVRGNPSGLVPEDRLDRVEWDSLTPLEYGLVTDGGAGRSRLRVHGVSIRTAYHIDTGMRLPWPVQDAVAEEYQRNDRIQERVEFLSPTRWLVWLDGELAPESPFGEIWMPRETGENPYGFIPGALFNNLETEEATGGSPDIKQSVYDVQQVSEIWSDVVYASRMYVPANVLKTSSQRAQRTFTAGIGAGYSIGEDDDMFSLNPQVDWQGYLRVFSTALELALANARLPAMAVGLEHTMTSTGGADVASGKSKAISYRPLVQYAMAKRKPFARGVRELVAASLRMAATEGHEMRGEDGERYTLGLPGRESTEWASQVTVDFSPDIIPTDKLEDLQRYTQEVLAGLRSELGAMQSYHGWGPDRAAEEADMRTAEARRGRVAVPTSTMLELVRERQDAEPSQADKAAAADVLFGAQAPMPSDAAAEDDEDGDGGEE